MKIQPLWEYRGQKRPDFAVTPVEGQESVWDYPRPQPGGFYGGWVTDEIVGPVKGAPQTEHW